jgi:ABC-type multidrug transport system permease subunit
VKALSIARKTLLELIREPILPALVFLFPALLIAFYYVAFGGTREGLAGYLTVLVLDEDTGGALADGEPWLAGEALVESLRGAEYEGQPVFEVVPVASRRAAEIVLRERKAALLVVIPSDFSERVLQAIDSPDSLPAEVTIVGDTTSDSYIFVYSFVEGLVRTFANGAAGRSPAAAVDYTFLPGTGTMSDFDFGVGGIIVFGVMFVTITTAQTLVREEVGGTLRRLRLTRARAADLLIGVALAQLALTALLVPVTFGVALLFGFRSRGSLWLAIGIGLLLGLSAVGLGLVTACFARSDGEAANLGAALGVLMVLVSGALYPMPAAPLATIGGRTIQVYDLLPTTHAAEALRQVLILDSGPAEIGYELAGLFILGALILAASVALYGRLKLSGGAPRQPVPTAHTDAGTDYA